MAHIGLFYGSNTGKTEYVAQLIKEEWDKLEVDAVQVFNIGSSTPEQILQFDFIIFGIPTWNVGQLQDDWDAFMPKLDTMDFTGKHVAIFGLGDQNGYGWNFQDAAGILAQKVLERRPYSLNGLWETTGYEFVESLAIYEPGWFYCLAIDEEGQTEKTAGRVAAWVQQVHEDFELSAVGA